MVPKRFRQFRAYESETNTPKYGSVSIGGKTYNTVKIGNQEWLAENLDFETDLSYKNPKHPEYGRYYKWDALNEVQKALPSGWRVPDDKDWKTLVAVVGGIATAGVALKSKAYDGRDDYGFNAQLAGNRDSADAYVGGSPKREIDHYRESTQVGYYWSSSEYNRDNAYSWNFLYSSVGMSHTFNYKANGFSVRCVRDSRETDEPNDEGNQHTRPRIRLIK